MFLGSLLGTCRSAIFFSLFLVTVPEVFAEGNSSRFPSLMGIILTMITGSGRELLERKSQCFYLRGDDLECIHG